jgi:serine/threonine protein kinase
MLAVRTVTSLTIKLICVFLVAEGLGERQSSSIGGLAGYQRLEYLPGSSGDCKIQLAVLQATNKYVIMKLYDKEQLQAARRETNIYHHIFRQGGQKSAEFIVKLEGKSMLLESATENGEHCLLLAKGKIDFGKLLHDSGGQLKKKTADRVCLQMAEIVSFLHSLNVVWGDVKPSNFIQFFENHVTQLKAIDFSESCVVGPLVQEVDRSIVPQYFAASDKTTPEYCSPERMTAMLRKQRVEATPQQDIWSLGMVMYQVLAHRNYFAGKSDKQIATILTNPEFKVDLTGITSREAKSVLRQMLQIDPASRGTMDQILTKSFFIGGASISASRFVRLEGGLQRVEETVAQHDMRLAQLDQQLDSGWQQLLNAQLESGKSSNLLVLLKQYIDHREGQLREFVGSVVQKLPLPSKFVVKKGRFTKTLGLVFTCKVTAQSFTVSTRQWARWLKVSISLLKAGVTAMDSGVGGARDIVDNVKSAYDAYKARDDEDFKTFVEQPFLLSTERDELIKQLRSCKDLDGGFEGRTFFDVFRYDAQVGDWVAAAARSPSF